MALAGGCLLLMLLFVLLVVSAGTAGLYMGLEVIRWIVPLALVIFLVYLIIQKKKAEKLSSNSKGSKDD